MRAGKGTNHVITLCLLAAFNGMLFGIVVEVLRRTYTPIFLEYYGRREVEEASRAGRSVVSTTSYLGDYIQIPLMAAIVFAVTIPVLYSYLRRHFSTSALLWQISGIAAAIMLGVIHTLISPWEHRTDLYHPAWRWLICLSLAALISLVCGVVAKVLKQDTLDNEIR